MLLPVDITPLVSSLVDMDENLNNQPETCKDLHFLQKGL